MIIDFHTHCFHDKIAPAAIGALQDAARIAAAHDGTAAGLLAHMAQCGVDKSVVLSVATKPAQVGAINAWALENRQDRLCFFAAAHPDDTDFIKNLDSARQSGFKGVKLHPDYQRFFADEPRMMPLYEAIRDLGLILVLHAGVDIGYPAPVHCTPLMLRRVLKNVPGIKLVAAHMGSHALWRDAEEVLAGLPLYLDTSYSHEQLGNSGMARFIRKHGAENVLFGTDSPWKRADDEIARICGLPLTASEIECIVSQNASRLLA